MTSGSFQNSPTPMVKPALFGFGKENGQMDMHNHHQRRTMSESSVYPSQVFYDTPYNPLYNHAYARSLTYSTQYIFNESKSPGAFDPNIFGAPSHHKAQASRMSPQPLSLANGSANNAGQIGDTFGL
jgi:hypothetical protein